MKKSILVLLCFIGIVAANTAIAQYTTTTIAQGLDNPVAFTFLPDGKILYTEKAGRIKLLDSNGSALSTFYNLSDSTFNDFERGLLGIEIDPNFATNHYVYCYYNHLFNNEQKFRVVRFTENAGVGTNPFIVFNRNVGGQGAINGNHVGGNLHFRRSEPDKIYLSIGDVANIPNAQVLTNPYGKILRFYSDGSIPTDNPFYDDGNPDVGNNDFIWSYGHRNPFDFTFSPFNDSLYISENGLNTWDEVNYGLSGANYGWGTCEGFMLQGSTSSPCTDPSFEPPLTVWPAPLQSITGILFYTGQVIPELNNHVLVGNNDAGELWDLELGNAPFYDTVLSNTLFLDLVSTGSGLTTVLQGPEGCIYAMRGGYTSDGKIFKVCPLGISISENTNNTLVSISPNPANDIISVQLDNLGNQTATLQISDMLGKILITQADVSNETHVNIETLPQGMYQVMVSSNGFSKTLKLVVGE